MYGKASAYLGDVDPSVAENLADLLYEIGRDLLDRHEHEMAIKWLERSYDALCSQSLERLSPDASELRMSTLHDLGQSLAPTIWYQLLTEIHSQGAVTAAE